MTATPADGFAGDKPSRTTASRLALIRNAITVTSIGQIRRRAGIAKFMSSMTAVEFDCQRIMILLRKNLARRAD
jgi:hypothetical protein